MTEQMVLRVRPDDACLESIRSCRPPGMKSDRANIVFIVDCETPPPKHRFEMGRSEIFQGSLIIWLYAPKSELCSAVVSMISSTALDEHSTAVIASNEFVLSRLISFADKGLKILDPNIADQLTPSQLKAIRRADFSGPDFQRAIQSV